MPLSYILYNALSRDKVSCIIYSLPFSSFYNIFIYNICFVPNFCLLYFRDLATGVEIVLGISVFSLKTRLRPPFWRPNFGILRTSFDIAMDGRKIHLRLEILPLLGSKILGLCQFWHVHIFSRFNFSEDKPVHVVFLIT